MKRARENDPGKGSGTRSGARRLVAGLRISSQDESLLAVVRPYLGEAGSEGELAYRLWRRGLELMLAEVLGLGVTPPPDTTEEHIAGLVAQRLLLCMPLLRRSGMLARLGLDTPPQHAEALSATAPPAESRASDVIDETASATIAHLGGGDFL